MLMHAHTSTCGGFRKAQGSAKEALHEENARVQKKFRPRRWSEQEPAQAAVHLVPGPVSTSGHEAAQTGPCAQGLVLTCISYAPTDRHKAGTCASRRVEGHAQATGIQQAAMHSYEDAACAPLHDMARDPVHSSTLPGHGPRPLAVLRAPSWSFIAFSAYGGGYLMSRESIGR